ncbi:zinc-binding alcohol dehydrogenase family protein [Chitinophaga sp.]|uniref:zinc-binding alcohol dehydrogenase family protein n=1 Tax=Chitinophaga sp. TaxID=1869181 RepID=UPI002F95DF63
MRNIAVISTALAGEYEKSGAATVSLFGQLVNLGMVESEDTAFDAGCSANEYHVLVRKSAFSVNFRDLPLILKAGEFFEKSPDSYTYFPFGSDFVATVMAVGKGVKKLAPGDRVIPNADIAYINGQAVSGIPSNTASKEIEIFPEHKLVKIPQSMPVEVAAGFSVGAQTSYSMIGKAHLKKGDKILVTAGSSNTSLFLINALLGLKADVTVLTSSPGAKEKLMKMGVEKVIEIGRNEMPADNPQFSTLLKEQAGFDVIFDPFFDVYFPRIAIYLLPYGRYLTCGLRNQHPGVATEGEGMIDASSLATLIIRNNLSVIGNCLGDTGNIRQALNDYENEALKVAVDTVFSGAASAGDFIFNTYLNQERFGKVIFKYDT